MRTFTEAAQEEYTWITEVIADYEDDVKASFNPRVQSLYSQAKNFHSFLKEDGEFAKDFFHTMEMLKGICGDLGRAIRGEELPAHIQKLLQEERAGFGFDY
jgi:hypothetical protein